MLAPALYIVATPIGNLADITYRAVEVLQMVDWVAAEDTRHSQRLLNHYQIKTPMFSLHEHNEAQREQQLLAYLSESKSVALISDAGTPLVSDPGYRVVQAVLQAGYKVVPVPGACAAIAGLVSSGLPTDRFVFEGFLPAKGAAREKRLEYLVNEPRTIILYESCHRIVDLFELLLNVFGQQRQAAIARELTKTFETVRQGPVTELLDWLKADANQRKGEFVVMLQGHKAGHDQADEQEQYRVLNLLMEQLSLKQSVQLATEICRGSRKELYALALTLKKEKL